MDFTAYDVAIIPVITGLIQAFKNVGLPKKFSPLVSLGLGILAGVFYIEPNDLLGGILTGLVAGLSASGLYNQAKTLKKEGGKQYDSKSI